MNDTLRVELVYALPQTQRCFELHLPRGATVRDALEQPGLAETLDLDLATLLAGRIGIFGRKVSADTRLRPHDRIEIYRPLLMSPTEARRLRARTGANKGDR